MKTLFTCIIGLFFIFLFIFSVKLVYAQSCSGYGIKQYKPTGVCDTVEQTCCQVSGAWSEWGTGCPACDCSPGAKQGCGGGNGSQTCNSNCKWNSCVCNSGYHMENGVCKVDRIECISAKPTASQRCGRCGTQTRAITCDYATGNWQAANWGTCSGEYGVCTPGDLRYHEACDTSKCHLSIDCIDVASDICTQSCNWETYQTCYNPTQCCCKGKSNIDGGGEGMDESEGGGGNEIYMPPSGGCNVPPYLYGCVCSRDW